MAKQFLDENQDYIHSKHVSVLSAPLADSVSWGEGTDRGPEAILDASLALESFDDELEYEPFQVGIDALPPLSFDGMAPEQACKRIGQAVADELQKGRFPIVLGGEHTVSVGAVRAMLDHYPDLHVLQLDAHLDLRDSYEDNPLSHACVMRRMHDMGVPFTQVGIRSFSRQEWEFVRSNDWQPFTIHRIRRNHDWLAEVCDELQGSIYLTCDVDVFDPAVMPATGTPEPDGLSWGEVTELIRLVAGAKNIVGCDFVELAPHAGLHHAEFTVAKLVYRTIGYIFSDDLR